MRNSLSLLLLSPIIAVLVGCSGGGDDDSDSVVEASGVVFVAGPYSGSVSKVSNSCDSTSVISFNWTVNQTNEEVELTTSSGAKYNGSMIAANAFEVVKNTIDPTCESDITIDMSNINDVTATVTIKFVIQCNDSSRCNAEFSGVASRRSSSNGSGSGSVAPTPIPNVPNPASPPSGSGGSGCCKMCSKGIPCGNTCIASNKNCHVGPGCAC